MTYFQTAFRVQSPWTITDDNGKPQIMKQECYVFDFALDRALKQISDYSCRLNVNEDNPEKKVAEFISFLPVLAYDGSTMKQISAQDVLDIALAGTSATLLARRWESALLVNVDNETLSRLLTNQEALDALMKIEGFRFATRIPIFMYLTDYRERTLKDVITQLEPELFKKVTGLDVHDFEMLCTIGVFNASLMNDAIFKFKRYEDSSLSYTGIDKHEGLDLGGWDTVLKRTEYDRLFYNQQGTMASSDADYTEDVEDVIVESTEPAPVSVKTRSSFVTGQFGIEPTASMIADQSSHYKLGKGKEDNDDTVALDLSGVTEGAAVYHKSFGKGIVMKMDKAKKHIRVTFTIGEKNFLFPDAFVKGFLKTENDYD